MMSSRCPFEVGSKERGVITSFLFLFFLSKCVVREQVERIRGDSSDYLKGGTRHKGQATGMCVFDKG